MRADMFKVIVERPRRGGSYAREQPRWRLRDVEDEGPKHGPIRLNRSKSLNENLSPLYRFLDSRVGQHWSKVYSEVCQLLRPRNTVQAHVLLHLKQHVALHVQHRKGEWWVMDQQFLSGPRPLRDSHFQLYVHPLSGVLMTNRHYQRRRARTAKRQEVETAQLAQRVRVVSDTLQLHCLKGDWYAVEITAVPLRAVMPTDVLIDAGLSDLSTSALYRRDGVHASSKRLLSKKELKQFGLR